MLFNRLVKQLLALFNRLVKQLLMLFNRFVKQLLVLVNRLVKQLLVLVNILVKQLLVLVNRLVKQLLMLFNRLLKQLLVLVNRLVMQLLVLVNRLVKQLLVLVNSLVLTCSCCLSLSAAAAIRCSLLISSNICLRSFSKPLFVCSSCIVRFDWKLNIFVSESRLPGWNKHKLFNNARYKLATIIFICNFLPNSIQYLKWCLM